MTTSAEPNNVTLQLITTGWNSNENPGSECLLGFSMCPRDASFAESALELVDHTYSAMKKLLDKHFFMTATLLHQKGIPYPTTDMEYLKKVLKEGN